MYKNTHFSSPAGLIYATVGVHPCSANTFDEHPEGPSALLHSLETLALTAKTAGTCTAYGEIGLDYDRLSHASKPTQLKYFAAQLDIAVRVQLPLFLHSRAAADDFERLLRERLEELPRRGLVHSFTGTVEEMRRLVGMGFHVGVNGCSMKTEGNAEVVRAIPLERLQIETDGPWVSLSFLIYIPIISYFPLSCAFTPSIRLIFLSLLLHFLCISYSLPPSFLILYVLHHYIILLPSLSILSAPHQPLPPCFQPSFSALPPTTPF